MFVHHTLNSTPKLRSETAPDGRRLYITPEGKAYVSVTTMLGSFPNPGIDAWKERVGEAEAKKVSAQAARRGTSIHKYAEDYINNLPLVFKNPFDQVQFSGLKKALDNHLGVVYGQEMSLYSDRLELAGTTDLIGEWDGKLSIIDYKTSRRKKDHDHITGYFLQSAIYAMMLFELTGMMPKQTVVLITVDHEETQMFVEKVSDWVQPVLNKVKEYRKRLSENE